jgi:microcompartment protein CcmK/EutM
MARVLGEVVSTVKDPEFHGRKLLLIEKVDLQGKPDGNTLLAVDLVDAGRGDLVLVNQEGGGARLLLESKKIPLQAVIVGVVDDFHLEEE